MSFPIYVYIIPVITAFSPPWFFDSIYSWISSLEIGFTSATEQESTSHEEEEQEGLHEEEQQESLHDQEQQPLHDEQVYFTVLVV